MTKDEEEDEDYDEPSGGNQLLGFMFGNVDNAGDLDIDYLDEDAKEHLAALADKLGPSLTDIDLMKSSPSPADVSEQDYDEKAEDAVDYEDFDEQYDGPEVESATEEDYLLPKKEFFNTNSMMSSLEHTKSVFDEENYDEDEETANEGDVTAVVAENLGSGSAVKFAESNSGIEIHEEEDLDSAVSAGIDNDSFDDFEFQEDDATEQNQSVSRTRNALPVLCVEDGLEILRFSEIFCVHEPPRRPERKLHHKHSIRKDAARIFHSADMVEEDEEVFLRKSFKDLCIANNQKSMVCDDQGDMVEEPPETDDVLRDSCICAQPMKDDSETNTFVCQQSPSCANLYPLDQHQWEDSIIWGNSPISSHGGSESCIISENDVEVATDANIDVLGSIYDHNEYRKNTPKESNVPEPFVSSIHSLPAYDEYSQRSHQQLGMSKVSKKDTFCSNNTRSESGVADVSKADCLRNFDKLHLLNKELLQGSWVEQIIWDSGENLPRPKLILDLQDDHMLFEVLDQNVAEHLRTHAGAMMIERSSQCFAEESHDAHTQGTASGGRFNISNDKFYSNRKTTQQAKSHAKKRSLSIKIMHSIPALKMQTMKPKLSNKELSNFHRPKAIWFPHFNKAAIKFQGAPCNSGPMVVIVISLGGKPIKLHVNAEDTLSSLRLQLFKKLELDPAEPLKIIYHGKVLDDDKSFSVQNVRPNSVIHIVRTRIHLWPKAQKLPGENKPLRPPGAFKRKSDLSVKDGHVFLMEYCEERPLLLGNMGMCARLCTYYQKTSPGDQTASVLRNGNNGLGSVLTLDPADKSPFLGDIGAGCSQSCLETNMYRAPVFPHKLPLTDFLLVRSAKGMLSLRRIDRIYAVGQQEPHIEVPTPGSKIAQTYLVNRMLVYVYREFSAREKPGSVSYVRADELAAQFPGLTDAFIKKRLKHCADLKRGSKGQMSWVKRRDFRIPSEEELRRMLVPENVCSYESMQAGHYRLKQLGINKLTLPTGLSTAMNRLPDEAIVLAAASHIEREVQITPWNLTTNFVSCITQNRENIERLEITGVGDPSGRGLGFSYVKVPPKAPVASAVAKKKAAAAKGGSTVTGTDADLRRLSMDAARELLHKFGVPEEQIDKLTRWHRIALVRKLSSEQPASGVEVDPATLNKFARGQRMSFLQLQQQTREKCQDIWDRQAQSLTAAADDENDSEAEVNSDLDSFAGDLENLLDAEEFEEEEDSNKDVRGDKADGVRGFKMRRCPSQVQTEEAIEDDAAEACVILRLLEDDEAELKKKKKLTGAEVGSQTITKAIKTNNNPAGRMSTIPHSDGLWAPEQFIAGESNQTEKEHAERNFPGKFKLKKGAGVIVNDDYSPKTAKKKPLLKDGNKGFKEKKALDRPLRETFVCGACGQLGHMRTNKNCPKYGEDVETSELGSASAKSNPDASQLLVKPTGKKLIPKLTKTIDAGGPEISEKVELKKHGKVLPVKFKFGSSDKASEKNAMVMQVTDQHIPDSDMENKSTGKISKIKISNKMKAVDMGYESPKSSVLKPLVGKEKDRSKKKIVIRQPKISSTSPIREVVDLELDHGFRKTKKITELSSFDNSEDHTRPWFAERSPIYGKRLSEEEVKRKKKKRIVEEKTWRMLDEEQTFESNTYETYRNEELKKASKKKKKKKHDFRDEYLLESRPYRNDRRITERDRAAKRRVVHDLEQSEYAPYKKRRRGGEVELSNILEEIVDSLRARTDISALFLKPVTRKEAPDYSIYVDCPMDLSTIKAKVRNMEYKHSSHFRQDVWQIARNAHRYNDGRNPGIPPLADQLLDLCDYYLNEREAIISSIEDGIDN